MIRHCMKENLIYGEQITQLSPLRDLGGRRPINANPTCNKVQLQSVNRII